MAAPPCVRLTGPAVGPTPTAIEELKSFASGVLTIAETAVPSAEDLGYEALDQGLMLEMQGRVKEAVAVYQQIIDRYPDGNAGRDARKSIEMLKGKLM